MLPGIKIDSLKSMTHFNLNSFINELNSLNLINSIYRFIDKCNNRKFKNNEFVAIQTISIK